MKTTIVLMMVLFAKFSSVAQSTKSSDSLINKSIDWRKASSWRLYSVQGHGVYNYSIDTLKSVESSPLNSDSIKSYLTNATILPHKGPIAWMGGYAATYNLKGKIRKADISNYGGFIYDETSGLFYQVPEDKKENWMAYIDHCFVQLVILRSGNN